jgi:hypothetical protein
MNRDSGGIGKLFILACLVTLKIVSVGNWVWIYVRPWI